ncbi:ShlB/FhaC/HecB family hemolysin secretion/activation protein, partial [Andreprevotia chitinilytica]|uniref:ShlB/FhaC/HecB family hemolysin secretion/activation protein n=1 Tax=Andreprevotia chitinilytica TaxID=396808 RepID=UPI00055972F1
TVLRVALNQFERFQSGDITGYWTLEGGASRGMRALGASQDPQNLNQQDAHSQFHKLDVNGSLSVMLGKVGPRMVAYRGNFSWQWAHVGLFSSQQIFAGGTDSVRGFSQGGISGDKGGYVRNELYLADVPDLPMGEASLHVEPYFFFDGGRTTLLAGDGSQHIIGSGLGLRWVARRGGGVLNGDLQLGRGLSQPVVLGPKQTVFQANVSMSF